MTAQPSLRAKLVAEFVGTFLLVFTVGCNVLSGSAVWSGVSIACVLMVAIYALGGISGANFNPAVSVTLGITKTLGGLGLDWPVVAAYAGVQALAGVLAAASYSLLFGTSFDIEPAKGFTWLGAGLCELLYTFVLCFVVLNVAAARKNFQEKNQYYGLAIGFVIVAGAYAAGPVSGGCFNPAVALGIDLSSAGSGFGWCAVYVAFQMLGAALASLLFAAVRPEDFGGQPRTFMSRLASEFAGTFVLVLTVGLNVLGKSPAAAYSIAAALMCMIYALGDVSGAHFNPAVTAAILASGRSSDLTCLLAGSYVAMQLAGGVCAGLAYSSLYDDSFPLGPVGESTWGQVAVAEFIFSFLLCFVVLCVAVSRTTKTSQMFGLAIGACVTVGGCAVGSISGGSFNPAVSLGISASHVFTAIEIKRLPVLTAVQFGKSIIYSVVEIAGGLAAAGVFSVTHHSDTVETESKGFA